MRWLRLFRSEPEDPFRYVWRSYGPLGRSGMNQHGLIMQEHIGDYWSDLPGSGVYWAWRRPPRGRA